MIYVLMPWSETPDRIRGFEWITNYYKKMLFEVVVQTDNNIPMRRAWAINQAFRKISSIVNDDDILIINDADCVVGFDDLKEGVRLAGNTGKLIIPHTSFCPMSKPETRNVIRNFTTPTDGFPKNRSPLKPVSGVNMITVKSFKKVTGYDERFIEWGWEDNAFKAACDNILGESIREGGTLYHFWHEKDAKKRGMPRQENRKLNMIYQSWPSCATEIEFQEGSGTLILDDYCIKSGYISRNSSYFDDTGNKDRYQDNVYEFAKEKFSNSASVCDIGCGSGFKLMKYFYRNQTIGIDLPKTVEFCKNKYRNKVWSTEIPKNGYNSIICSDVIEHMDDPAYLLKKINEMPWKNLVISTVERDICRGVSDNGPPKNVAHCREWNAEEFQKFCSKHLDFVSLKVIILGEHNLVVHLER